MRVTALRGARHTGKATLAQFIGGPNRSFVTLDDPTIGRLARQPESLLRGEAPLTIAEIQRSPQLLHTLIQEAERREDRGRVLLTTPFNQVVPHDSIGGLMGLVSHLTLWPMTRRELLGLGRAGLWSELLSTQESEWLDLVAADPVGPEDWRAWVSHGGLPIPALKLKTWSERSIWLESYITSYLERDLRALSNIASLPDLRRIMRELALQNGELLNQRHFARDLSVPQPTIHRHLNLLAQSFMLVRLYPLLPSWYLRSTRRPRLYCMDTAVGLHLADWPEPNPSHLKSLVLLDLIAWRDAQVWPADVCFWESYAGVGVDFVIDQRNKLVPIAVTTAERPSVSEASGIAAFRRAQPQRSCPGLLLHCGEETSWILPGILAAPWWRVV
jgi:predicted AAA+ superfamily ATPase